VGSRADERAGMTEGAQLLETGLEYVPGQPVLVSMRKRGYRYDIDDRGEAVRLAGTPRGWLEAAKRVVLEYSLNVNRAGVVFVQGYEWRWRDLDELAQRIAATSVALHAELLELADEEPARLKSG